MIKHQGGCHCGNIKFSTEYDPMLVMACHCKTCDKMLGVGTGVTAIYGEEEVSFEGELKRYSLRGSSGNQLHYEFCGNCGNNIVTKPDLIAGMMYIHVGSFDNPQAFTPKVEIWNKTKPVWFKSEGCIVESFEDNGSLERIQMLMENLDQRQ